MTIQENITNEEKEVEEKKFSDYYDTTDYKHAKILEKCSVMCRSGDAENGIKGSFTDDTKINAIRELLKDSEYKEIFLGTTSIWYKGDILSRKDESKKNNTFLVSTHCDLVEAIKKPFSELYESGYYKGTYDNCGTNAAAVITMLEGDLPDNVIFAFTADEETGRCKGAKHTAEYLEKCGIENPICIALDVTYEGYDEGRLASVENCVKNQNFLQYVTKSMLNTEVKDGQSYAFVKKSKKAIPENLPKEYLSTSTGMYDEAFAYGDLKKLSFSFCLPCDGMMHSDSGLKVRQPGFEGYLNTLQMMLYDFTKTHPERIEAKKIENETLLERIEELLAIEEANRPKYTSYYSGYNYHSGYEYDDDFYSYNQSYGLDEYEYYSIIEEVVDNNIEAYEEDDKEMFIQDMISILNPDLYAEYMSLYGNIATQFEEKMYELKNVQVVENIDDYLDDDLQEVEGYYDDLDFE